MKLIENLKFRKAVKEFNKAKVLFPLWNYKARKEGFACWEDYMVYHGALTSEQVEQIHQFELREGRLKYGCEPLFWTAEDWQDHLACQNGSYRSQTL